MLRLTHLVKIGWIILAVSTSSWAQGIHQISAGYEYNLALDSSGNLWSWGSNAYGQLGNPDYSRANFPVKIEGITWLKIWAGPEHALGMASDSTIYSWGLNDQGQLGDSTTSNRFEPVAINTDQQFIDFAMGEQHTLAIASDSSLWAWGDNSQGQLGLDHKVDSITPTLVDDSKKYIKIGAASHFSVAVDSDGDLYAWGNGRYYGTGQGSGDRSDILVPNLLIADSSIVDLNMHYRGVQAFAVDGRVFSWGYNNYRRHGNDNTSALYIPTRMTESEGFDQVFLGQYNGATLLNDTLTIWGLGTNGQLGDGTFNTSYVKIQSKDQTWVDLQFGAIFTIALNDQGEVYTWGDGSDGALGTYSNSDRSTQEQVIFNNTAPSIKDTTLSLDLNFETINLELATDVDGDSLTYVIEAFQYLQATGGSSIQIQSGPGWEGLGYVEGYVYDEHGATTLFYLPITIGSVGFQEDLYKDVEAGDEFSLIINSSDSLVGFGRNGDGQLGNDAISSKSPTVLNHKTWAQTSGGQYHALAIDLNGHLYAWGNNNNGRLGDGTDTWSYNVKLIDDSQTWLDISAGTNHSLAITSDSLLYAWGSNTSGQLGDTTNIESFSPILIDGTRKWIAIAAGEGFSLAIASDSTLWAWGDDTDLTIPDGASSHFNYPVQIGTSKWIDIAAGDDHALAMQEDSTVYTWGSNESGQLGTGDELNHGTPQQINTNKYIQIEAGNKHSGALAKDSILWLWGSNNNGESNEGGNNQLPQIYSETKVLDFSLGLNFSIYLDKWNRIHTVGRNNYGQLGLGHSSNRSDPETVILIEEFDFNVSSDTTIYLSQNFGRHAIAISDWLNLESGDSVGIQLDENPSRAFYQISHDSLIFESAQDVTGLDELSLTIISQSGTQTSLSFNLAIENEMGNYAQARIISNGEQVGIWIDTLGQTFIFGSNSYNQLGIPGLGDADEAVLLEGYQFSKIEIGYNHVIAIDQDGALWGWGDNDYGEIGSGDNNDKSTPTQSPSSVLFQDIKAGEGISIGLSQDSLLYAWGSAGDGILGDPSIVDDATTPVEMGSGEKWIDIGSAFLSGGAIRHDSTLWTWGYNGSGELGLGDEDERYEPTQVGVDKWIQVEGDEDYLIAQKSDSTLWFMGFSNGHLGEANKFDNFYTPTQMSSMKFTSWTSYSDGVLAITAEGDLYGWGNNSHGIFNSDSSVSWVETPELVSDIKFKKVSMNNSTVLAIDTAGNLYSWGSRWGNAHGINKTIYEPTLVSASNPVLDQSFSHLNLVEDFTDTTLVDLTEYFSHEYGYDLTFEAVSILGRSQPTIIGNQLQLQSVKDSNGIDTIQVFARQGSNGIQVARFEIDIQAVNDAPVILSTQLLSTDEDHSIPISSNDFTYSDAEGDATNWQLFAGDNYSLSDTTITPDENFFGTLKVPFFIEDTQDSSSIDTLIITVTPINDHPVITGTTPQTIDEDDSITLNQTMVTASDIDGDDLYLVIRSGENYTFVDSTIIPNSNYFGELTVEIQVTDGELESSLALMSITVNSINDEPVLNNIPDFPGEDLEDDFETLTFDLSNMFTDVEDTTLDISVISHGTVISYILNDTLFIESDGIGIDTLSITAEDSEGAIAEFEFEIIVETVVNLASKVTSWELQTGPVQIYNLTGQLVFESTLPSGLGDTESFLNQSQEVLIVKTRQSTWRQISKP